ncbi:MAG: hypothetical protein HUU01_10355 [Saprospiraceae bacterium]|nr:hypothetical protein [Saprospiraceae bacterium]
MRTRSKKGAGGMSTSKIIMTAGGVVGGIAVASLVSKSSFASANPIMKVVVPLAGAIALPMIMGKGAITSLLATGMAVTGVTNGVIQFAPGLAATVGLAGAPGVGAGSSQWKSNYNPGVAGPSVVL